MKILIAAVCDHAWVESGCLSIARTFDSLGAEVFPYTLARMSIALRILIGCSEAGKHILSVRMVDADGRTLMDAGWDIDAHNPSCDVGESALSFALNGQNITFPAPGDYSVDVFMDGKVEAGIPIYVRRKQSAGVQ